MKSREYFHKRAQEIEDVTFRRTVVYKAKLGNLYENAKQDIERDIHAFYQKFAVENSISFGDARKYLSNTERGDFQKKLKRFEEVARKNNNRQYERELKILSAKSRITRHQSLLVQVKYEIEVMTNGVQLGFDELLGETYKDRFYRTIHMNQTGFDVGADFTRLDKRAVDMAARTKWLGANYSDRIYENKEKLVLQLEQKIGQAFATGTTHADKLGKNLAKSLDVSRSNANRLAQTETAFVAGQATKEAYKKFGLERYEFLATLDSQTSEICQELDEQIFDVGREMVGVNYPPMHPNCRSTTVPWFLDFTESEKRFARSDGKSYDVPGDMNYEEWYGEYVEKPAYIKRVSNIEAFENIDKINTAIKDAEDFISLSHKEVIYRRLKEIKITRGVTNFERKTGILKLDIDCDRESFIHELGHVIETELDFFNSEKFLKVLYNGLENINPLWDVQMSDIFESPVLILNGEVEKFVSTYQRRVYSSDLIGNGYVDSKTFLFNARCMGEYFAEGYNFYHYSPKVLLEKDPDLFKFIKEMI